MPMIGGGAFEIRHPHGHRSIHCCHCRHRRRCPAMPSRRRHRRPRAGSALMAFTTEVSAATTASVWIVSLFLAALGAIRLS